jgi:hypothetical protein
MTDLEVQQHGALQVIRDLILSHGATEPNLYAALVLCDEQHKAFLKKVGDEARATLTQAPQGPGGVFIGD